MNKIRRFNVDYRDKNNSCYNMELLMEITPDKVNLSNESIIDSIISDFQISDLTVSVVIEIINGYTAETLKILPAQKMTQHLKLMYINPDDKVDC